MDETVPVKERRLIGYWRNEQHPEYPDPTDLVDESWDAEERHMVWSYLCSGTMVVSYMGLSTCRVCGKHNGALEFSDGTYQWPEGLAHYVYDHAVRLPPELVEHAIKQLDSLEAGSANLDWWLAVTRH
jgi:hypothetical protein